MVGTTSVTIVSILGCSVSMDAVTVMAPAAVAAAEAVSCCLFALILYICQGVG